MLIHIWTFSMKEKLQSAVKGVQAVLGKMNIPSAIFVKSVAGLQGIFEVQKSVSSSSNLCLNSNSKAPTKMRCLL